MQKLKYIWFTHDGGGISIARKLIDEGNTVIIAQIQSIEELHNDKDAEKPEDKKHRLALFNGLVQKYDAKEVIKMMAKIKNKDEWFVVFDFNNLWYYSELILKMGFTQGFFPLKKDFDFEQDRDAGKDFVKKYYPSLKVGEKHEFKTTDDGVKFLDTDASGNIYVLKSFDEAGSTVLPMSSDPELAKEEIKGALELEKSDYEKKGYLLEQKIVDPLEITPEAMWYNGKLICTIVDIENKPVGAGSLGNMTGCSGNLIFHTNPDDEINKIAFPPKIHQMAKEHKGLMVWDASILIDPKTGEKYFGEFCANRWGWDSFFTELSMCKSVSDYFEALVEGRNPIEKQFGVGIRMFNLKKHIDVPIIFKDSEEGVFMYDATTTDKKIVSCGVGWDLLVATGSDNDANKSVDSAYDVLDGVSFTNGYYRPRFDFLSREYHNSIIRRYEYANHKFFELPDFTGNRSNTYSKLAQAFEEDKAMMQQDHDKYTYAKDEEVKKVKLKHKNDIDKVKKQLKDALAD